MRFRSHRTAAFTESVIREMSRWAARHQAVNLAQGFPDFPAPEVLKQAAAEAIARNINQYAITWGARPLREAIAAKYRRHYQLDYDPEREITVCCGATEGMIASLLATVNPGEEVVVFEPFYENYRPDALLSGAVARLVPLHPPDWTFDPAELRAAFNSRTKAIILNSPNNPTGRVFTLSELRAIAELAQEFDTLVLTDEIYEHILYDGAVHHPMATLPGMRDRTVLVNSMSKTWSVTGWRVGWVCAPAAVSDAIRKVHDFLTVGAAAPLQHAGAVALAMPDEYYEGLREQYAQRRSLLLDGLAAAGFRCTRPEGAYYILTDISEFGFPDDVAFVKHMIEHAGVAAVPGSSFFEEPRRGAQIVRFCFCKKEETLAEACRRLTILRKRAPQTHYIAVKSVTAEEIGRVHFEDIRVQHGRLVAYASSIQESTDAAKRARLIAEFVEYYQIHASDEEQFMRSHGYPQIEAHAAEHRRLIALLSDSQDGLARLLDDHLATHDQAYLDYFRNRGIIPPDATLRSSEK